ncbi:bacteriocin-protection protein, YdeI/OmpD-associated family [Paraflavitalea soli]|uniref:Bacteriocin-protection protein, YdeI/OmpD-associated family n=1 Tax=Paraflavitalea soli TaxID=2315862 RepID=A0A3B7MNY2_9BACT|nr:YdeI/OmpD-associated family protein [Paraflavitalea soli]AXY75029.1 bacteriocin-protection protein, YdeI/OmpD-associated family [Paraflavitalea soli]
MPVPNDDLPVKAFKTSELFEAWVAKNQEGKGLWLRVYKKDSGIPSITITEALDVALCYGWIDGQRNKYDEESYIQKYTPRRPGSLWSKKNIENTDRLIKAGRMTARGLKEIAAAKADGRWAAAYDSPANSQIPEDFLKAVKKNKAAWALFQTLNKTNLFAISWRLQTAKKPETREKRMHAIIAKLEKGEKFH